MWLAIDTATGRASVAVGMSAATAFEETVEGARRHAAQLIPMIDAVLRRAEIGLSDLTGLVLSDGPGSFTGLRVAAAAAKALVQTRGVPLWVVPSLLVQAAGAGTGGMGNAGSAGDAVVLAVSNALRGELYAAAYRFTPEGIVSALPPAAYRPDIIMGRLPPPAAIVGNAPPEIAVALEAWTGRPMAGAPGGAVRAALAIDLVGQVGGATLVGRVASWEPIYGRPAEAQARWEMAHGRPLPNPAGGAG